MKILLYGINYAPELTGIGKYSGELGAWLAARGHTVEVITAHPYYPEWRVPASHRGKRWFLERIEGVCVYRTPLYVPGKATSLRRILHEFSFAVGSLPHWGRAGFGGRFDVVICVAPAFHLGLLALLYAKFRRVPLVYHIQDLQVDAAKELGMISNPTFLKTLFSLEKLILNHATLVSTISEGMLRKIQAKGVAAAKTLLFPNWVDETHIRPVPKAESLRAEFGLHPTDQVVLYAGNLGEKQGLDLIIEVARRFRTQPSVRFLIVGSGGGKATLEEKVRGYGLENVLFFPLQPYEKLSALLATADLHLVLQKKSAADLVMPSKLTGILAAGGCALVTALPGTSLHRVVERHELGILVEPESVEALRQGLETALSVDLERYRRNARTYAETQLGKEAILHAFEQTLLGLITPCSAGAQAVLSDSQEAVTT